MTAGDDGWRTRWVDRTRGRRTVDTSSLEDAARLSASPTSTERERHAPVTSAYVRAQRRLKRSPELLRALEQLDAATDPATQQQLADWISQNCVDEGRGELLGLFAKCYLGHPYVDHQLSMAHQILRHFTPEDEVPPAFSMARSLVRSPAYLFVEVYGDGSVIPVRANGDPVT